MTSLNTMAQILIKRTNKAKTPTKQLQPKKQEKVENVIGNVGMDDSSSDSNDDEETSPVAIATEDSMSEEDQVALATDIIKTNNLLKVETFGKF